MLKKIINLVSTSTLSIKISIFISWGKLISYLQDTINGRICEKVALPEHMLYIRLCVQHKFPW